MSAEAQNLLAFAVTVAEEADPYFDEELAEAAIKLAASGPVGVKLSTRVGAALMSRWKLRLYTFFCRELPERYRVAPAPAMQRGFFHDFREGDAECTSPDDQLLVMPVGRSYSSDTWDVPVECRPRDPSDRRRYETLKAVFGVRPVVVECTPAYRVHLRNLIESVPAVDSRLRVLEEEGLPAIDSRLRALEEDVRALVKERGDASESS